MRLGTIQAPPGLRDRPARHPGDGAQPARGHFHVTTVAAACKQQEATTATIDPRPESTVSPQNRELVAILIRQEYLYKKGKARPFEDALTNWEEWGTE